MLELEGAGGEEREEGKREGQGERVKKNIYI